MTDNTKPSPRTVKRIKTGAFERRASLFGAGFSTGTRMAGRSMLNLFRDSETRKRKQSEALSDEAQRLVEQIGELKGSVVKVGQMMALYGEHFLPEEVTAALHTLEDQTAALEWPAIRAALVEQIGEAKLAELDIETTPLGAASLGQVHVATRKTDGKKIALKIQYPGVAEAIDTDIDSLAGIMRVARMVPKGPDFEAWLDELRQMLYREVDYEIERQTTDVFRERLIDDPRYVVPHTYPEYSSQRVLATSYEPGVSVASEAVAQLPQQDRSQLGLAALELFFNEFFCWHVLQTDPNFGNYRIRISPDGHKMILLDFGAVREYDSNFLHDFHELARGAYYQEPQRIKKAISRLKFFPADTPDDVYDKFVRVCYEIIRPFRQSQPPTDKATENNPENLQQAYTWGSEDLPTMVATKGGKAALSKHFQIPPREFIFLIRKMVGVYTYLTVLEAEFAAGDLLDKYIQDKHIQEHHPQPEE